MKHILKIFMVSAIVLHSCQLKNKKATLEPIDPIVEVNPEQFETLMNSITDYILLDVRTPEETKQGKIENSLEINFRANDFESAINQLDPNKSVLVYCASGGRSMKTAKLLEQKGFPKIYNLNGGYQAWKNFKSKE